MPNPNIDQDDPKGLMEALKEKIKSYQDSAIGENTGGVVYPDAADPEYIEKEIQFAKATKSELWNRLQKLVDATENPNSKSDVLCHVDNCTNPADRQKFVDDLPTLGMAFKVGVGTFGVTPGVAIEYCPFCGRRLKPRTNQ